ncbi:MULTISPECIES: NmrA/HSCARG family protein [Prochlorococcus]|uniref:NmrA/HSCARG family protein n=1 Tax=Prochlorococcus TaxID=1218 RepID=UPI0009078EDC|nr:MULTISPECIES: NmrA/HSCARG family protein [Prochlorococcus]
MPSGLGNRLYSQNDYKKTEKPLAKPVVVVTMATGLQGKGVVKHLAKTDAFRIRALTRYPSSKRAKKLLAYPNVELVKADLLERDTLDNIFEDAYAVFGNTTPTKGWRLLRGSIVRDYEMIQGRNLIEAIKKSKDKGSLKHFVFSSICKGAKVNDLVPAPGHFLNKWELEEFIAEAGLSKITTILRPVSYYENFYIDFPGLNINNGTFAGVVGPDFPWQTIAVDDVGAWTRAALLKPSQLLGQAINLAGEDLTGNQMAVVLQSLKEDYRTNITYSMIPRNVIRLIEHDIATMATWIESSGYGADLQRLKKLARELGVIITPFSAWLHRKFLTKRVEVKKNKKLFIITPS